MKLSDLQRGSVSTIAAVAHELPANYSEWKVGQEVQLLFAASIGEHIITDQHQSISIDGCEGYDRTVLEAVAMRSQPRVCWLAECQISDGKANFVLQVHEFAYGETWAGSFPICVDSELVDKVRTSRKARVTVQSILEELRSLFLLPPGINAAVPRALVSMSPEGRTAGRTIRLVGAGKAVDVRMSDQDGALTARAYRIVQSRALQQNEPRYPLWLVHADIQFTDRTDLGCSPAIRNELDVLVKSADSYLRVWELYGQMEKKALDDEAEEFGSARYTNPKQIDELHWSFRIPDEDELQRCVALLQNGQHKDLCMAGDAGPDDPAGAVNLRSSGELVRVLPKSKTVELQTRSPETLFPSKEGKLVLDLTGDSVRHERRAQARDAIRAAECPMPKLGLILEGRQWTSSNRKKWQKVPKRVLDSFKSCPTEGQLKALLMAINTPDIALIQGPPGTGKTQVISALLTWLSLIGEDNIGKTTLITSFQQDAVDTVAERSRVFGLPPIRIGGRRHSAGSVRPFEIWMADMRHNIQQKLVEYGQKPVFQVLNSVKDIYASYAVAPGLPADAAKSLEEVSAVAGAWLSPELCDRGLELRQRLERQSTLMARQHGSESDMIEAALRGLRTDPDAFADDGPRSCFRLQKRLEPTGMLTAEDSALLSAGAEWSQNTCPDFLPSLRTLQDRLLDVIADVEPSLVQRQEIADVSRYLRDAAEDLDSRCKSAIYGKDAVLFQFAATLERDPYGCEQAVEEYAAVLAATVGQSVGRGMSRIVDANECFENVIVDEAARANPLDLMIPLSRAERRIILVGDHRQLPHVLEVHIEREVNRSIEHQTKDLLGKSMFERLLEHVREQERHDGIPRYARLDKQFRMHPALAEFVSDAFYKPYGEDFTSGVSAADYSQEIAPYGQAVAVWKRMPLACGPENPGRSKSRPVEARWVAQEAHRLLNAYPQFSIGIITFYTAQVKSIEDALLNNGVMYVDSTSGDVETSDTYKLTESRGTSGPRERLRVGTVDAFQGKEFDLVLLSMTRSNDLPADDEKAIRRKYGHLVLENRLCVAMSRQKRLLVVAGDDGMLSGDAAVESVPALVKFRKFCGGEHGAVI